MFTNQHKQKTSEHDEVSEPLVEGGQRSLGRGPERRGALQLAGLAAVLFAVYLVFGFVVPQTPGRLGRPSAALITELGFWRWVTGVGLPVPQSGLGVAVLVVSLAALAFAGYGLALWLSWKRSSRAALGVAIVVSVGFAAVSIFYLPSLSSDIFNYMMRGRLAVVYGESPYYVAVDRFPNDPFYPYTSPEYRHSSGEKLPAWMVVNAVFAALSGDDPVRGLFTYRAGFLLLHLANLALLAYLVGRTSPQHQLTGVIAYGWSPIVALHALNKTDTVMVFFLLAALFFLIMQRRRIALVPLILSAFVKMVTLPLAAILFMGHVRARRWRTLLADAAVVIATITVIYLPFARDPWLLYQHLGLDQVVAAATSAPSATAGINSRIVPHLGSVSVLLWLGFAIWVGFAREVPWTARLRRWAILTFLLVLLFSKLEFSWYLMTPLAMASIAGSGPLISVAFFACASSFLFNVWQSAAASGFELPHVLVDTPRSAVHLGFAGVAAAFVLAVAFVSARARKQLSARTSHG